MSEPIIRVDKLSKKYVIGHQRDLVASGTNLRDEITKKFHSILNDIRQSQNHYQNPCIEEFWALKEVSFEIERGERVGIIGRNGAGKSTLLKILSRITEPTSGRIEIKGRVASLLEVGTGFHQELTGRENIFLNGAILGMQKAEIKRKFDEIVAFAEIEKFLDTPVKRYSSGMYVRLAFAVAAHLDPEILVVDEVLAVGDAVFQKKCLGKMEDVSKNEGRTVLFVSHNMGIVQTLCSEGIMLAEGQLILKHKVDKVIEHYCASFAESAQSHTAWFQRPPDVDLWIESASILTDGSLGNRLTMGGNLSLKVTYNSVKPEREPRLGLVIFSSKNEPILNTNNRFQNALINKNTGNSGEFLCELGRVPLIEGFYYISFWLGDEKRDYHYIQNGLSFEVVGKDLWGRGVLPNKAAPMWWPTNFQINDIGGS